MTVLRGRSCVGGEAEDASLDVASVFWVKEGLRGYCSNAQIMIVRLLRLN